MNHRVFSDSGVTGAHEMQHELAAPWLDPLLFHVLFLPFQVQNNRLSASIARLSGTWS